MVKQKSMSSNTHSFFGCQSGNCPFRYLGIPMHFKKLRNSDCHGIVERFEKKLSSWKGKHLSVGGRLVLINLVLTSLVMYMLSFLRCRGKSLKN